jgi:hypothetical protein
LFIKAFSYRGQYERVIENSLGDVWRNDWFCIFYWYEKYPGFIINRKTIFIFQFTLQFMNFETSVISPVFE